MLIQVQQFITSTDQRNPYFHARTDWVVNMDDKRSLGVLSDIEIQINLVIIGTFFVVFKHVSVSELRYIKHLDIILN